MPRKSRKNVGLIGLGIIGSRVAAGLRGAGYKVYVWSRTPRPEPNFLGSAAKVAEVCEVIQLFVSDAEAVFETIERLSGSLTPHHVLVCNSTIGPTATREAARRVELRGATFVDAPFTGSKEAAAANQLVYYLGGGPETLDRVEPILQTTSKAVVRVGDVGQAATVKIALNIMVAVSAQCLAEALAVVRQSGVSQESFAEALMQNGVRSALTDAKMPKMLARNYEAHFSLKNMFKDVQLAIHMANAFDLDIPATTATAGVMYGGLNRGWGEQDFSVLNEIFPQPAIEEPPPAPPAEEPPAPESAPEPAPPVAPEASVPAETPKPPAENSDSAVKSPEDAAPENAPPSPATKDPQTPAAEPDKAREPQQAREGGLFRSFFGSRR